MNSGVLNGSKPQRPLFWGLFRPALKRRGYQATGLFCMYHYREEQPREGAVEFWTVTTETAPELQRTGFMVPVVLGAHDIRLVP
jgi:hypothetical protein